MKHRYAIATLALPLLVICLLSQSAFAQSNSGQDTMKFTKQEVIVAAKAAPDVAVAVVPVANTYVQDDWNAKNREKLEEDRLWNLKLYGYIRTHFHWQKDKEATDADPDAAKPDKNVNDYFGLAHARLGLKGDMFHKMFGFNILLDGGANFAKTQSTREKGVNVNVSIKDAYVTVSPGSYLTLTAGQFIPNFNYEGYASTSSRPFANLSIANALSVGGRELGVSLGASKYSPFSEDSGLSDLGFSYDLTFTNSNDAPFANPGAFGFYASAGANWGKMVGFNFGYYLRPKFTYARKSNAPQNAQTGDYEVVTTVKDQGIALDLLASVADLNFVFSFVHTGISTTDHKNNTVTEGESHNGIVTFLQYHIAPFGITPGLRYALLQDVPQPPAPGSNLPKEDPTNTHEITLGLNWEMKSLPIRAIGNYTFNTKKETVGNTTTSTNGHAIDLVLQAKW